MEEIKENVGVIKEICTNGICTACGACINICPKNCVLRIKDASNIHMEKGTDCINCGLCEKVCPVSGIMELSYPKKAFAGWNADESSRITSASGGIAAAIYQYAAKSGAAFVGAFLNDNFECHLRIGSTDKDIAEFKNSKYTYSFPDDIYKQVAETVKLGKTVFFIWLPCQVAAVRKYFEILHINTERLCTVDIICHGTPDPNYLIQHITTIDRKIGADAQKCFFRDAKFGTLNFAYTLYKKNLDKPYYVKYVDQDDLYQIGYHNALIYRDSCYSCKFAQASRPGDLTIGDFHVFDVASCDIDINNVSTILANTEKGQQLVQTLEEKGYLKKTERPLEESIKGEKQLRHPSIAGPEHEVFLNIYKDKKDYDAAAEVAFRKIVLRNRLHIDKIKISVKKGIRSFIPQKVWISLKTKIKGNR